MADVEAPLEKLVAPLRAHARPVHHRRAARALLRRSDQRADARWSAPASSCAASCARPAASASGATPRSCAACAAPRWPCCARRSRPPTSARWPPSCPSWQGVDRHPAGGAGVDRLREVLVPLQGLALPADVWERDVLPRRCGAYSPTWLDQLCASGEVVWVGAGRARAATRAAWRSTSATTSRPSGRRPTSPSGRTTPEHDLAARAPGPGAVLLHRPAGRAVDLARADPGGAVGPRVGRRGDQRRVGAAARAAAHARPRPARARSRRGPAAVASARAAAARRRRSRAAGR